MFRRKPRQMDIDDFSYKLVGLEIAPSRNIKDIVTTLSARIEQAAVKKKFEVVAEKYRLTNPELVNAAQQLLDSSTHFMNSIESAYQAVAPNGLTGEGLLVPQQQNLKVTRFWQSNSFYFYVLQNIADIFALLPHVNLQGNETLRNQLLDDLRLLTGAIYIMVHVVQNELSVDQKNNFSVLMQRVRQYRVNREKFYDTTILDKSAAKFRLMGGGVLALTGIFSLTLMMSAPAEGKNAIGLYAAGLILLVICSISLNTTIMTSILLHRAASNLDKQAAVDPILSMHKSALFGAKNAQVIFEKTEGQDRSFDAVYAQRFV